MSRSPSHRSWARRATYCLSRIASRLIGVVVFGIRCEGRRRFPREGGALVCANHQSFLDPVLVGLACDRRMNYLARETLFRFAPFRWLITWHDAIPIDREGSGIGGLKETLRRLKRGELVLVFPEGTRTQDGHVGPLKPGLCAIARRSQVPLVPVGIDGAFEAWPPGHPLPRPASIRVHVGQPISVGQVRLWSDVQLIEQLGARLQQCHAAARRARQTGRKQ
jgi:1-acyl-sn-glycerol-3-phosphate acyltransferase